jgi:hypothetical protein
MATAICGQCGDVLHWRAQRGVRLADFACKCGGAYKAATYQDGRWVMRKPASGGANAGRAKTPCAICGHQCFGATAFEPVVVTLCGYSVGTGGYAKDWQMKFVVEPDDVICRRHTVRATWSDGQVSPFQFDGETRDWLLMPINGVGANYYWPSDEEMAAVLKGR